MKFPPELSKTSNIPVGSGRVEREWRTFVVETTPHFSFIPSNQEPQWTMSLSGQDWRFNRSHLRLRPLRHTYDPFRYLFVSGLIGCPGSVPFFFLRGLSSFGCQRILPLLVNFFRKEFPLYTSFSLENFLLTPDTAKNLLSSKLFTR